MRLARLESDAQRLARTEQVLLAYDFVECSGPEPFGQWRGGFDPAK
jgi:hypothetical protein